MDVIVVDDEPIILAVETAEVKKALPDATVTALQSTEEVLEFANHHSPIDIAFLDINLEEGSGLELTRMLQELNPKLNVIFCTGYSEYALEAIDLRCSDYLMKPMTTEKLRKSLDRLLYPVKQEKREGIFVRCFGNFEVFSDDVPVKFRYARTKELFAFLIDRNGAMLSTNDLVCALFEEDDKASYIRNLKADMLTAFQLLGREDIFIQSWGKIGIDKSKLTCDYYDYLAGHRELFQGEYMSQFPFSDVTLAGLLAAQ